MLTNDINDANANTKTSVDDRRIYSTGTEQIFLGEQWIIQHKM